MEGSISQYEEKINVLNAQIANLEEMLTSREETIKSYEDKAKELVFQNNELLESLETKENDVKNAEVCLANIYLTISKKLGIFKNYT